jgi:branched-chain amino acid aminotransferase
LSLQIYIDGKFVPREEAKISVFDHGFLYGDGIFEGIRAYNGRVWKLTEHLDRLYESAKGIWLEIPATWREMEQIVLESCARNDLRDAYIRLVVSRGVGDLGLDPRKCPRPSIICIADKITLYPPEVYQTGMKVITVSTRKSAPHTLSPQIKSLNYLPSIMAKITAAQTGHPEVVMLNPEGYVAEGTGDNIFIVKKGKVLTPPTWIGILPGITRAAVLEMCQEMGIPCEEQVFTQHDLYNADECFVTGTAAEICPIVEADARRIGTGQPGPITQRLIARFRERCATEGTPIYPETVKESRTAV